MSYRRIACSPPPLWLCAAGLRPPPLAAEPLKVVASFSILGDLVAGVGGEHVDGHDARRPERRRACLRADAGRRARHRGRRSRRRQRPRLRGLARPAGRGERLRGPVAVASTASSRSRWRGGARARSARRADERGSGGRAEDGDHHHGGVDPHAWQSVANAEIYVKNIADGALRRRCGRLRRLPGERRRLHGGAERARRVDQGGLRADPRRAAQGHHQPRRLRLFRPGLRREFLAPQGVSTEAEASAADVATLIEQIRERGRDGALRREHLRPAADRADRRARPARRPGGELYSDALSEPDGPAPTYVEMMRHNADLLQAAMRGAERAEPSPRASPRAARYSAAPPSRRRSR